MPYAKTVTRSKARTRPANVILIDLVDLLTRAGESADQFLAEHRQGCECGFCRAMSRRWDRLDPSTERADPTDAIRRDVATVSHLTRVFAAFLEGQLPGRVASGDAGKLS